MLVTHHAKVRFTERVMPCSLDEAEAAILTHARAVEKAAEFRCSTVRCGDGSRLILEGEKVVTVLGKGQVNRGHWIPLHKEAA